MAIEQIGYGGIGGLIIAGLSILGLHKRIDKKLDKEVFMVTIEGLKESIENQKETAKEQREDTKYIRERIDLLMNGNKL